MEKVTLGQGPLQTDGLLKHKGQSLERRLDVEWPSIAKAGDGNKTDVQLETCVSAGEVNEMGDNGWLEAGQKRNKTQRG